MRVCVPGHLYVRAAKSAGDLLNVDALVGEQLKKLASLKEMGFISEEEFDQKKADLLAKL